LPCNVRDIRAHLSRLKPLPQMWIDQQRIDRVRIDQA